MSNTTFYFKTLKEHNELNNFLGWISYKTTIPVEQFKKINFSEEDYKVLINLREFIKSKNMLLSSNISPYISNEQYKTVKFKLDELNSVLPNSKFDILIDYGCGTTSFLSESIAKELNIPNVISYKRPGKILEINKIGNIPENSKLLVTFFMSLHHMPHISKIFQSIGRLKCDNITIFIKEELVENEIDIAKISLVHMLYECVLYKIPEREFPSELFLRTKKELEENIKPFKIVEYEEKKERRNSIVKIVLKK